MIATAPPKLYTADEFMRIPDPIESGYYELVNGELRLMSPAGGQHGIIGVNLLAELIPFVRQHKLGRISTIESGFRLFPDENTVRAPDIAFVAKGRLATIPESYVPLAPDLAIEVVSPGDSWDEIDEKTEQYLQANVRLIWVIVPRRQAVYVYHPDTPLGEPIIFGINDTLDGEDVIPGFRVKVSALFNMDE